MIKNFVLFCSSIFLSQGIWASSIASVDEVPFKGKWTAESCAGSTKHGFYGTFVEFIPDEKDLTKGVRRWIRMFYTDGSCQFIKGDKKSPDIRVDEYKIVEKADKDGLIKIDFFEKIKGTDRVLKCMDVIKVDKHTDKLSELFMGEEEEVTDCYEERSTKVLITNPFYFLKDYEMEGLFESKFCEKDENRAEEIYFKDYVKFGAPDEKGTGKLEGFYKSFKDKACTIPLDSDSSEENNLIRKPNSLDVVYTIPNTYDDNYFKKIKRVLSIGGNKITTYFSIRPIFDVKGIVTGYRQKYAEGEVQSQSQASSYFVYKKVEDKK